MEQKKTWQKVIVNIITICIIVMAICTCFSIYSSANSQAENQYFQTYQQIPISSILLHDGEHTIQHQSMNGQIYDQISDVQETTGASIVDLDYYTITTLNFQEFLDFSKFPDDSDAEYEWYTDGKFSAPGWSEKYDTIIINFTSQYIVIKDSTGTNGLRYIYGDDRWYDENFRILQFETQPNTRLGILYKDNVLFDFLYQNTDRAFWGSGKSTINTTFTHDKVNATSKWENKIKLDNMAYNEGPTFGITLKASDFALSRRASMNNNTPLLKIENYIILSEFRVTGTMHYVETKIENSETFKRYKTHTFNKNFMIDFVPTDAISSGSYEVDIIQPNGIEWLFELTEYTKNSWDDIWLTDFEIFIEITVDPQYKLSTGSDDSPYPTEATIDLSMTYEDYPTITSDEMYASSFDQWIDDQYGGTIVIPPFNDNEDLFSWLGNAVDGFFSTEIVPGISFGGIFWVVLGIAVVFAFLKYFAGG